MSLNFAATVVETQNVVAAVRGRAVLTLDETTADAKVPAGQVAVIDNYRGHVNSGKGKPAYGAGESVVDLSCFGRTPARELPELIAYLEELKEAIAQR